MRFNDDIIQEWIRKSLLSISVIHLMLPIVLLRYVGLYIGDEIYSLTNIQEALDYFGIIEDMSVFKITKVEDSANEVSIKKC